MKYPVPGRVYSSEEVIHELILLDAPFFMFYTQNIRCVVQHSHVTDEQLLVECLGFRDLRWKYVRTTSEWIPIFHAEDDESVLKCVDIEPVKDPYIEGDTLWVTPKGLPREQYDPASH